MGAGECARRRREGRDGQPYSISGRLRTVEGPELQDLGQQLGCRGPDDEQHVRQRHRRRVRGGAVLSGQRVTATVGGRELQPQSPAQRGGGRQVGHRDRIRHRRDGGCQCPGESRRGRYRQLYCESRSGAERRGYGGVRDAAASGWVNTATSSSDWHRRHRDLRRRFADRRDWQ